MPNFMSTLSDEIEQILLDAKHSKPSAGRPTVNDPATLELMMQTIITNQEQMSRRQESQAEDIATIKDSMVQIVLIEERQTNQNQSLQLLRTQISDHDDHLHSHDLTLQTLVENNKKNTAKGTLIASAIATATAGLFLLVAQFFFIPTAQADHQIEFVGQQLDEDFMGICAVPKEDGSTICAEVPISTFRFCKWNDGTLSCEPGI